MGTGAVTAESNTLLESARIEACLDGLSDTLESLARISVLDDDQRSAVRGAVSTLLDDRVALINEFAQAFTLRELERYRATHRDQSGHVGELDDRTVDEALHYYALLRLAEASEVGSAGHLRRTAAYCRVLARALGCKPEFIEDLGYAAQLHDVGLIVVPDVMLEQRGMIEGYERTMLDLHTKAGAFLVNSVIDALRVEDGPLVLGHEVVLYHHERHDGLGVLGLVGEAIPYSARVFQFADAYDALRRPRPHRPALGHDEAVAAIRDENRPGVQQFDPALIDTFVGCAPEFATLFDEISAEYPG